MKRYLLISIIIVSIILLKFIITYIINASIMNDYDKGKYNRSLGNLLYIGNVNERYIAYYNNGNLLYQNGEYEKAIQNYKRALSMRHPMNKKDCKIRINLVLAMLNTFDLEDLDEDKINRILGILSDAKDILTEKKCAGKYLDNGHNADAETLKKEIEDLERLLRQNPKEDNQKQNDDNKKDDNKKTQTTKEQQLRTLQEQANSKRMENLDSRVYELHDYKGKKW